MADPSNPSSPNCPPFALFSKIKRAFYYARPILSKLRAHSDTTSNSIPRARFYLAPHGRSQECYCLPLSLNSFDIEMQNNPQRAPVSLGKTVLSLTYQAVAALTLSSSLVQVPALPMHVLKVSMIIGFAASFSGIYLRYAYPRTASIIENIGSLFAAVEFFILTSVFLPGSFTWVSWLAGAFCFLVFFLSFLK